MIQEVLNYDQVRNPCVCSGTNSVHRTFDRFYSGLFIACSKYNTKKEEIQNLRHSSLFKCAKML